MRRVLVVSFAPPAASFGSPSRLVEALQLVGLDRRFILVQVRERILCPVVMGIIVSIDGLRLQTCNRVKLLDRSGTQPCESPEHGPLDLSDLCIFDGVYQRVLCLRRMVLQLSGGVFL